MDKELKDFMIKEFVNIANNAIKKCISDNDYEDEDVLLDKISKQIKTVFDFGPDEDAYMIDMIQHGRKFIIHANRDVTLPCGETITVDLALKFNIFLICGIGNKYKIAISSPVLFDSVRVESFMPFYTLDDENIIRDKYGMSSYERLQLSQSISLSDDIDSIMSKLNIVDAERKLSKYICIPILNKELPNPGTFPGISDFIKPAEYGKSRDIDFAGMCKFICKNMLKRDTQTSETESEDKIIYRDPEIGDKVYAFCKEFGVLEYEVKLIVISSTGAVYHCYAYQKPCSDDPSELLDEIEVEKSEFGKTVFYKREDVKINKE